jgi:hypothetical protein
VLSQELAAMMRKQRISKLEMALHGLAVHDTRLVSIMHVSGISQILTLNVADFARYPGIVAGTPHDLTTSLKPSC